MKNKKILLLALLLIAVMCMTLASCSRPQDYLEFTQLPDGTYEVSGGKGSERKNIESITIPETYEKIAVTTIGDGAFYGCTILSSITIPDSVTSIGDRAFYRCTNLKSITIPNSVTSIGDKVFDGCTNLTSITIPDSVTSIGHSAFWSCTGLTSITLPDSLTSIGSWVFEGCINLTSITIPDSVTSIGELAFHWCTGLTSITIPDSVTSIGSRAFGYCTNLTSVYYTGTAEEWSQIDIDFYNDKLTDATIYYYSETQPTAEGNYWHYVDGVATPW